MSIPSNYEINVAKKRNSEDQYGIHYCRIQLSEDLRKDAIAKFNEIKEMFGDDYHVTLTYWECVGHHIAE